MSLQTETSAFTEISSISRRYKCDFTFWECRQSLKNVIIGGGIVRCFVADKVTKHFEIYTIILVILI